MLKIKTLINDYSKPLLLSVILSALSFVPISSTQAQDGNYILDSQSIPSLKGEISIDGKLDETVWQQALSFELNYVTLPYENTAPPVATKAYIFDGGDTLYIGFEAQEPSPENMRANLRDRDNVWDDDLVGIILDTYGTQKLAYHFYVNPLGVQIDAAQSEVNGTESDDWDTIWRSKTHQTKTGFSAEFAIPMTSLHFNDGGNEKTWGVELLRWYQREVKYRLSHIKVDRNNSCALCQLQPVSGFKEARKSQKIEINPSLVVSRSEVRNVYAGEDWQSDSDIEFGADVNWHITSDDLLSATFNPDFSQIEIDDAQISVNNDFALYFPEKRRFFLQNQNYFDSFYNLLHTRNIVDPDYGVKFTSRKDQHTIAALIADDNVTSLLIPGNLGSRVTRLNESSQNAALRYRYDYGNDSSLGVTTTFRESDNYHNYVVAFDGNYRFTDSTAVRWHILGSETQYPDYLADQLCHGCSNESSVRARSDDKLTGIAWQVDLSHDSRNWWFYAKHIHNGEDVRADLGFEEKVDWQYSILQGALVSYEPRFIWNKQELRFTWSQDTNINNDKLRDNWEIQANLFGDYQSKISTGIGTQSHVGIRYDGTTTDIANNVPDFDLNFAFLFFEFRPAGDLYFSTLLRKGKTIDWANNRRADQFHWQPIISWDASRSLQLKATYTYENLDSANDDLYVVRLTDLRADYQFNSASKLRFSLIYENSSFNADNFVFPISRRYKNLGGQLVYTYRYSAFSALYVGYSANAVENDQLGSLIQNERNAFAKLTLTF